MKWLWRVAVPNRFDALFLVITILLIAGHVYEILGSAIFSPERITFWCAGPATCALVAIGCCLGWWSFNWRRLLLLLLVCLISPFVPMLIAKLLNAQLIDTDAFYLQMGWMWGWQGQPASGLSFEWHFWLLAWLIGCFLGSWILVLLFRFVPRWIVFSFGAVFNQFKSRVELSRVKLLVGVAASLFLIATINNILIANGINVFRQPATGGPSDVSEWLVSFAIGGVVFGFLVFWPSWGLLLAEKIWIQSLAVATLVVAAAAYIFAQQASPGWGLPIWLEMAICGCCVIAFWFSVIGVKKVVGSVYPSIWSLVPLALSCIVAASPLYIDYSVFMNPNLTASLEDRFYLSLESGELLWKTRGQVRGTQDFYICKIQPDCRKELLNCISLNSPSINLIISDAHPGLETQRLRPVTKGMSMLKNGKVTASQLTDIAANSSIFTAYNVDVDSSESKAILDVAEFQIHEDRPGKLAQLLSSIEELKGYPTVNIFTPTTFEDLPGIVELSKSSDVNLLGDLPNSSSDLTPFKDKLENVTAVLGHYYGEDTRLRPDQLRFLIETNVKILPKYYYAQLTELSWDLAFAFPDRIQIDWLEYMINQAIGFTSNGTDQLKDTHFVWKRNREGKMTHLFFPGGESWGTVEHFDSLKVLSYDPMWLTDNKDPTPRTVQDLRFLKALTSLEELYFSDSVFMTNNLDFLLGLTKLKHLQIPNCDRSAQGTIGFDSCPSLESITFLGKPDNPTIAELAKLPNLKRVTISNINDDDLSSNAKQLLEKRLPGVEVKILPFGQHKPDVPEAFLKHREARQKEALKRLMKQAEMDTE